MRSVLLERIWSRVGAGVWPAASLTNHTVLASVSALNVLDSALIVAPSLSGNNPTSVPL